MAFGLARITERKQTSNASSEKEFSTRSRDFLSRFLEAQAKDKTIPPWYQTPRTPHPLPQPYFPIQQQASLLEYITADGLIQGPHSMDYLQHNGRQRHYRHPPAHHDP